MAWQAKFMVQNGRIIPWEDGRIHPHALAITYAASVFEGIRAYRHPQTGAYSVFRLKEHLERIMQGVKIMRFENPPTMAEMERGILDLIPKNEPDDDVYIRLQVLVEGPGTQVTRGPTGWTVVAIPRERSPGFSRGLNLGVSSWTRISDNSMPPRVKAAANYHASRFVSMQAKADGYDGALILNSQGKVSEGPGACLFVIRDGRLLTPHRGSDILESVTRTTVIQVAREMGYTVEETTIDRTELYVADEAFMCGTGQELVPIASVDRLPVGDGKPGPIASALQAKYEALVRGTTNEHAEWRTAV
ncbi:branched-chain amino acid transaminase [Rhodovarius crocodyli]|uniref:Branched-chain-amino-acid aminotransferase n=1 Tax=Rhodovarius crocodyli TaxID=1979269 RepID=A0A437MHC0_9PROT|nr:branched-chain amino acid transaminase [Rhodovarius crocodyli]RVT97039.1 branched-chain amino acid transaminase [Rhodovarius crocodyli]